MNITFLIGNGFDIGMGLKSSFKDFFPKYCEASKEKEISIRELAHNIEADEENWSYFERQLGQYTSNFDQTSFTTLIGQFKDFENSFISYLREEEGRLTYTDTEELLSVMVKALNQYCMGGNLSTGSQLLFQNIYNAHQAEKHTINFINFNYTSVLENCLKVIPNGIFNTRKYNGVQLNDKVGKVVHVHGTLDAFPIMGVNDIGQLANKELANNKRLAKFFVKPSANQAFRMNYDVDSLRLIEYSTIICVYGMSLGETDKLWWSALLKWLGASGERQLVIFVHDCNYTSSTQFSWLEMEDEIIDKFGSYTDENLAESLRRQIHIAANKDIFACNLTLLYAVAKDLARQKEQNELAGIV